MSAPTLPAADAAPASTSTVAATVQAIADELLRATDSEPSCSLEAGPAGVALFLSYYYLYTKEERYLDGAVALLEEAILTASQRLGANSLTLFAGFAGVAWVQRHLVEVGLLTPEILPDLEDIDEALRQSVPRYGQRNLVSLMYGVVGHGVYFVQKLRNGDESARQPLEDIADLLLEKRVEDAQGVYWPDDMPKEGMLTPGNRVLANIGLAHGAPGIICFLSTLHELNIRRPQLEELIPKAIDWLLALGRQEHPISLFPSLYCAEHDPRSNSRLAWCYGDLCVTVALLRAGRALDRADWYAQARRIALFSAQRDVQTAKIQTHPSLPTVDAAICHGTAGVSMLFAAADDYLKLPELAQSSRNWLQETLRAQNFSQDNIGGYSSIITRNFSLEVAPNRGLLEGAAGTGFVLLSALFPPAAACLARIFLLE